MEEENGDQNLLTKKDIRDQTNFLDEIHWLCSMYLRLGEERAKGIRLARDESTGATWDMPKLNQYKRKYIQTSRYKIEHALLTEQKKGKKRKRTRKHKGGAHRNNFGIPCHISQRLYDFFRNADLGTDSDGTPVQEWISGLKDGIPEEKRIMSPDIIRELFDLWILSTPFRHPQTDEILFPTSKDPVYPSRVYPDPVFLKYLRNDLDEISKMEGKKSLPQPNVQIKLSDGSLLRVPYLLFNPTIFVSLSGRNRTTIQDRDLREPYWAPLKEEAQRLHEIKLSRRND